jgi:hypothetical protein
VVDLFEGWVVEVTVVKSWVNLGVDGSAGGCGICCWCWMDAEAEAEPAAMAACRRRLERLPRLATDGRGDGECSEGCAA